MKNVWTSLAALFLGSLPAFVLPAEAATRLTTELVVSGLDRPVYVTAPPADFHRLFVVEQGGLVKIVKDGALLPAPFLDLTAKVSQTGNERGLLGFAFHPSFRDNGYVYVDYTRSTDHATMVERYTVAAGSPDLADPESGLVIVGPVAQPFSNHNGGGLQFGPDGMLYAGLGDGGSAGDPGCRAQDKSLLLGKILRVGDNGSVPADNPFLDDPAARGEIWAFGLRNPWRFSFDRRTGDLYIGDVGQSAWEEVDFQAAASPGGENYGWKVMEGAHCFDSSGCGPSTPACNDPGLTLPFFEYGHAAGRCAVTGGYVYRGCAIPGLQGTYFMADYCAGAVISMRYDGSLLTELTDRTAELAPPAGSIDLISSFGEDAEGELYLVDLGSGPGEGEIYKIVPDAASPYVDLGFALPGSGGLEPRLDVCGLTGAGEQAVLRLRDAAPRAPVFLVLSFAANPIPVRAGTLVPDLRTGKAFVLATDGNGRLELPFAGRDGGPDIFAQLLIGDPGAAQGVSFSNAVRVVFPRLAGPDQIL